jgi:hypothetical protein
LQTVGQAENLKLLTPEQITASREKDRCEIPGALFENDSITDDKLNQVGTRLRPARA